MMLCSVQERCRLKTMEWCNRKQPQCLTPSTQPGTITHPPAAPWSWDMAVRCLSPGVAAFSVQLCQATALCVQTALRQLLL